MTKPTLKLLAGSLAALSLACATATQEARPTQPAAPAAPQPPPRPPKPPEPPSIPDAPFRAQKPGPLPVTPQFQPPVSTQRTLKNGAVVLLNENHALPLVSVEVILRTGTNADPVNKAGLADFTTALLDEGTRTRKALEISAQLDDLAAELGGGAGMESMRVQVSCLSETLPRCVEILADVVQNPAFRPEDVERVRGLILTGLEQKKGTPGSIANDEAARLLYGEKHPWGQPDGGTPATVKAITREDLVKFHDTWARPNNAIISVAGDVALDALLPLLEKSFGGWKAKPLPKLNLPPVPELKQVVVVVDKPNASQSQVWVLGRLFPASSPDAIPMRVANYPLGGLFTSRLNLNLREEKGYSYGVRSGVSLQKSSGTFAVSGGIIAKNTAEALAEYEKELSRFSQGDVTEEELTRAKEAYIRSLPSILETNSAVAAASASLLLLGLPLDYYKTLPEKVRAVTLADVNRVARQYMQPGRWPAVVVGPQAQFEEKLKSLNIAPVEQRPSP